MLQKLTNRVYYLPASHETDRPVLGVITGDAHTLLLDAGNSSDHARLLLDELVQLNIPTPGLVVLTHWHWDHIFGLSHLNVPSISHKKTKSYIEELKDLSWTDEDLDKRVQQGKEIEFCAEMIKKEFPSKERDIEITTPTMTFETKLEIDLGNVTCIVEHMAGDHADDSSILYVKEEKVLFLGDALYPNIYASKRHYVPDTFLQLLDRIEAYDADILIESHGVPIERKSFFFEMNQYRTMAESAKQHTGDMDAMTQELTQTFQRNLTTDDVEMIQYFVDGL